MNWFKFLLTAVTGTMCFAVAVAAPPIAQDHNSTRSNRGAINAPADTDGAIVKKPIVEMQDAAQPVKGRNPQTGKEINLAEDKGKRTGRNPQTGKEISTSKKD